MEFPSFSRWGQLGLFLSSLNTTGLSHSKACASHTTVAQQAQPVGCAGIVAATINSNPQECNLIQALNGAKDFHIELRRKETGQKHESVFEWSGMPRLRESTSVTQGWERGSYQTYHRRSYMLLYRSWNPFPPWQEVLRVFEGGSKLSVEDNFVIDVENTFEPDQILTVS